MHPRALFPAALVVAAVASAPSVPAQSCQPFKVLVFTKTAGFVHGPQISAGSALIQALGAAHGFAVDQSADAAVMTSANLAQYSVVVFLHTTGDVLDAAQQTAFVGWIAKGGGFVGVHSAADTEYGWPFYGALLGTWFAGHPPVQVATLDVVDPAHPSTLPLPPSFAAEDEWYDFQSNVAANPLIDVLLTVDEATYVGGSMGAVHPISWCRDSGTWRSWYTGLGHSLTQYSSANFIAHLGGGILWAANSLRASSICAAQSWGSASGAGSLVLGGSLAPPGSVTLQLAGASPGGAGVLLVSTCPASASGGGLTKLVELSSPGFVGLLPVAFDAQGQLQFVIPQSLQLPGSLGFDLYLQGAQLVPALALSNGVHLSLCP
jgi:type 1 glutamine amidotransferase